MDENIKLNTQETSDETHFSVIIPVCNNLDYTKQCIESLQKINSKFHYEIIIIDNASSDGTHEYLENLHEAGNIRLISNSEPKNFSESNNQGAKIANGKYLIFLNNDTKAISDIFAEADELFTKDESIGIQGAKLLYPDNKVQHCGIVYGFLSNKAHHYHIYLLAPRNAKRVNKAREFQFVTGAFLAISHELFKQIGGFDEKYDFGYEDLDLCLKARKFGYKVFYNPKIELYHFEACTKKLLNKETETKFDNFFDEANPNREYFMSKWRNDLSIDDDLYYYEDGMHGILAGSDEQGAYINRIEPVLSKINEYTISNRPDLVKELINILFESDLKISDITRGKQFSVPMENIEIAEKFIQNPILPEKPENDDSLPPRVLFVMYGWNESGGGTTLPNSIAKYLVEAGFRVAVFSASLKNDNSQPAYALERTEESGVTLYNLFNRPAPFTDANNPEREIFDPNIDRAFEYVLDEFHPDVIHYHNFHGLTMSIAEIAKARNIPSCFTPHNYYIIDPNLYLFDKNLQLWNGVDMLENSFSVKENPDKIDSYRRRINAAKALLNEKIDLTLCVSTRQRELFTEFGINRDKMPVVHQANRIVSDLQADETLIAESKRELSLPLKFGFIGGVMPQKGVHVLALAAKYIPREIAEFHIYGFVTDNYKAILDKIDEDKRLIFHGEYKYEDLAEIGKNIDVAIVPSVWEDCAPLVVLELIAMHLPVIGAKIGGIPDFVIPEKTGFLYKYDDCKELVETIEFCTKNLETIREMRKNMPETYSFTQYSEQLIKIYKSLKDNDMKDPLSFELDFAEFAEPKSPEDAVSAPEPENEVIAEEPAATPNQNEIIQEDQAAEDESDEDFLRSYFLDKNFKVLDFAIDDSGESDYFDVKLSVRVYKNPPEKEANPAAEPSDEAPQAAERELIYQLYDNPTPSEPTLPASTHQLNIAWEGTQFVYHSLALVNREICSNIIDSDVAELTIIPYEDDQFSPDDDEKFQKLANYDIRNKDIDAVPAEIKSLPHVRIRHQWPPMNQVPIGSKWIIMQPWEMTAHRKDFYKIFAQADEIWTPSNFSRRSFINSGLDPDKVQVIPNGINPDVFTPLGDKLPIPTLKRFKFLYVGGTIYRKGIDILLKAYSQLFTAEDDVCLIIKDMGGNSFYKGQTAKEKILAIQSKPNAPEIHYIDAMLSEEETAMLYRSADVFVSPYRGEGFSLPTLEAMACGLPVIVTAGGATDDFVDEEVGYLIPSKPLPLGQMIDSTDFTHEPEYLEPDLSELAQIMKYIVAEPSELFKKGVAGMLRARTQWTWKNSTLRVYNRLDALYGTTMAREASDKLQNIDDDVITFARACEDFAEGNFDAALSKWNDVILSENLPQRYTLHIYHNLALHFISAGDFDKADSILQNAVSNVIEHPDNAYLRAVWYAKQGKYTEAYDILSGLYENWVYKKADSTMGLSLDKLLNLNGEVSLLEGENETALRLFTEALKFNNDSADACYGAGLCFVRMNAPDQAKEMFEWAIRLNPDFAEAREEYDKL